MGALVGAREFSRDAEGNAWILHAEDLSEFAVTLAAGVSAPFRDTLFVVDGDDKLHEHQRGLAHKAVVDRNRVGLPPTLLDPRRGNLNPPIVMGLSLKLPSLTLAAANWMVKKNRDYGSLASWDVAADGWPPAFTGDPIYLAILPVDLAAVPTGADVLCRSLQQQFDPEENFEWVFCPGLVDNEVWLVHVKRVPTALN